MAALAPIEARHVRNHVLDCCAWSWYLERAIEELVPTLWLAAGFHGWTLGKQWQIVRSKALEMMAADDETPAS